MSTNKTPQLQSPCTPFASVIEKFTENTRFCLICNYLSKIIPAIQSRCTRFRFGPLAKEQMVSRLEYVIAQESIKVTDDGMKSVTTLAKGDMRRALNIMQSTSMAHEEVNEETVYMCTGNPLPSDIALIVEWMLNEKFSTAFENIQKLKTLKGLALQDILTDVHGYVHRVDFPSKTRMVLLQKMADIEHNLAVGGNEKIQLGSLLGAFQIVRELLTEQ
jgi:replication factor C subunit 3/5